MKKVFKHSNLAKRKMSLARKGKKRTSFSEEWKKKLSEVHKRLGTKPPSFGGKHHSPESKKKISLAHLGKKYKPMSAEGRKNIGLAGIGRKHTDEWKKRMSLIISRRKLSDETRNKISVANKGRIFSDEHRKNIGLGRIGKFTGPKHPMYGKKHSKKTLKKISRKLKGRKFSVEHRKKIRDANLGSKSHLWKGGISEVNKLIRRSLEYRLWREAIFIRDNWTCQKCRARGGIELHPHHILNFSEWENKRFDIDNGITLCRLCHKRFHKNYGRTHNNPRQLKEFLSYGIILKKTKAKKIITRDASGKENGFVLEMFKNHDETKTELYMTTIGVGKLKGFHLHRRRIAQYICLRGVVRIIGYEFKDGSWKKQEEILDSKDPSRLYIPINTATGILNIGDDEAWLVNFPNPAYDPQDKNEQVEYSLEELKSGIVK